ncbi:thiamine-phosphate kinase [Williamsia sterculiae]|uniref:Thiamine-monophosphate kinase n=1 Tax=Williamsia sterculiae TaxID=1344003 RepID=A0A1N7G537_9NOCA|nr:thiamine-phosphate kinase [Williamsia sterculiae]SIS07624.1 thiamine-monophosphate kinase [Williamsia sterculiae]
MTDSETTTNSRTADVGSKGRSAAWTLEGPLVRDLSERVLVNDLIAISNDRAGGLRSAVDVVIGPGDDAAVLRSKGPVVVSTDTVVEGRHFRREWSAPAEVGARAAVQAIADIAAMGGAPTGVVVALGCPPDTPAAVVRSLMTGLAGAAAGFGAPVVGGDLVATTQVVVTVTVIGDTAGHSPVRLDGATVGDVVAVSGPLGGSAAGLELLGRGEHEPSALVAAHRVPTPRWAPAPRVHWPSMVPTAMTDVSDGLWSELRTMATASSVAIRVDPERIPQPPQLDEVARRCGVDVATWVLEGGEDHELMATFTGSVPAGWSVIGEVVDEEPGDVVVTDDPTGHHGWESF